MFTGRRIGCGSAISSSSRTTLTQAQTLEELQENLRDLHRDLTGGEIPGIRRVAELTVG